MISLDYNLVLEIFRSKLIFRTIFSCFNLKQINSGKSNEFFVFLFKNCQESKETVLSEAEINKANTEHVVPPSFVTPVKVFKLNNIFNNINE